MRIYIASDFHLAFSATEREEQERNDKVIEFLESLLSKADILILNGDIFDLWYDWQNTIIKGYFPILKKLADLKEAGCRLIFIAGNHDFWFGDFFRNYLDCEVHLEYFAETIDGKRVFVSHGDIYTSNDFRYHLFRNLLRNAFVRSIFSILHPEIALKLGKLISRTSRRRNPNPTKNDIKRSTGLDRFAQSKSSSYDQIILSHTHSPKIEKLQNGSIYINTGDWIIHNSYVEIIDGEARLLYFK